MMRALAIGGFLVSIVLFAVVEWAARREGSRIPSLADVCAFVMRYDPAQEAYPRGVKRHRIAPESESTASTFP